MCNDNIMTHHERIASTSRARNLARTKHNKSSPRTGMRQLCDPSLAFVRVAEQVESAGQRLWGVVGWFHTLPRFKGCFFVRFKFFCVEPVTSSTSTPRGLVAPAHLENSEIFSNALCKNRRSCVKLMFICKSKYQGATLKHMMRNRSSKVQRRWTVVAKVLITDRSTKKSIQLGLHGPLGCAVYETLDKKCSL
jgi:hypothetical protein